MTTPSSDGYVSKHVLPRKKIICIVMMRVSWMMKFLEELGWYFEEEK